MININFKPFPALETRRLNLIQISQNHVQDLYELLSDPLVAEYDYFYPVEDLVKVEEFINRYSEEIDSNSEITWGITLKENGELIGTCCLGNFESYSKRSEIGYAIKRKEWNKGYATEALEGIIEYGFKNIELNRIEATITPGNDSSVKVLEKLNFKKEGHVRERDYLKGQLVDGIIMGLLRREYEK